MEDNYKDMLNMMSESVFPIKTDYNGGNVESFGLSKREYFSAMAMQGWISATELGNVSMDKAENLPTVSAKWAVAYADALIKALNEGGQDGL